VLNNCVCRESGGEVPDWMTQMKKIRAKDRKKVCVCVCVKYWTDDKAGRSWKKLECLPTPFRTPQDHCEKAKLRVVSEMSAICREVVVLSSLDGAKALRPVLFVTAIVFRSSCFYTILGLTMCMLALRLQYVLQLIARTPCARLAFSAIP